MSPILQTRAERLDEGPVTLPQPLTAMASHGRTHFKKNKTKQCRTYPAKTTNKEVSADNRCYKAGMLNSPAFITS